MTATPFFGPAYVSRSTNLADCQAINLYPEAVETKQGKNIGALYMTPGLRLLATVGSGPIRQMRVTTFPTDPTLYVVSGTELFAVDTSYNVLDLGPINTAATVFQNGTTAPIAIPFPFAAGPSPVSMIDNGHQLAVFTNGLHASYMDGFGVINQAGTAVWWSSDLLDLSTWDALNFASADTNPDNVVTLYQIRREMFLFKELGTEIWDNVGQPGFVFARNQGVFIEHGIVAASSLVKSGDSLLWLGRSSQGVGHFIEMTGYQPRRVSTHGLEEEWQSYPTMSDAIAYAYQQAGHDFVVVTFPSGDTTWTYDRTESNLLGIPCWHRRAAIDDSGVWHRHWSNCYATFNSVNVVGDYRNGNLYAYDFNALLDDQTRRAWLRTWPAVQQGVEMPVRFPALRLDMETGIGFPDAQDPLVSLKWSDDGGHTWTGSMVAKAGPLGATAQRVRFPRLGQTRRNSGLYRIFQITSGDIMAAKLIGAEFEDNR